MERSTRISHGLFLVCFRQMKTKDLCIKKGEKIFTFYGVINSQISHYLLRQNVEIGTKQ